MCNVESVCVCIEKLKVYLIYFLCVCVHCMRRVRRSKREAKMGIISFLIYLDGLRGGGVREII